MAVVQIFARPPVAGRVKTRLIAAIGAAKATEIYRYCLTHTLNLAATLDCAFELWLSEESTDSIFDGIPYQLQSGGDLGERMFHALDRVLSEPANSTNHPLLIGSDCLDISRQHLNRAIAALVDSDLVLLPALDGGFALIGCRKIAPGLFDNIKWGSQTVLQRLLENAATLDYEVHLLEPVRDIDTLADLKHYAELRKIMHTD